MLKFITKKYAFFASCALLSLLLLILSGCDASSDPKVYYQATGSWEGTIDGKSVRGIIAPDGRYHLAVVDANGDFIPGAGEYVGTVSMVDKENNIGRISLIFLHPPDNASAEEIRSFKLESSRLFSDDVTKASIDLDRNSEADGPAALTDVAGRWSFSSEGKITNVVVDINGNFSGDDFVSADNGANCQYAGTLKLEDPSWNIFTVSGPPDPITGITGMTITELPNRTCPEVGRYYSGLAMSLVVNRMWLSANRWEKTRNSTDTFFGLWTRTINEPPVAKISIVGVSDDAASMEIEKIAPRVELGGQGSSDPNNDSLNYTWDVKISGQENFNSLGTGSPVTFTPTTEGTFTFRLIASDGLLDSEPIERNIELVWAPDPFVDCGNGTVLATKRATVNDPYILWLKDAGCDELNLEEKAVLGGENYWQWGVSATMAKDRVGMLANGSCGLTDGSVAGNWRLPLGSEFEQIIYSGLPAFPSPPQLVNRTGSNKWSPGDAFNNVGKTNTTAPPYLYWTSEPVPSSDFGWFIADFDYQDIRNRVTSYSRTNPTAVWPVRTASAAEVEACQLVAP